ncbi:MAG: electron transport complex subunit RsxC [Candidatus Aureabacteria bacterium]|nr:electron transport complex subunit RsxC [Candidatus Auribacterota bacterium]
MLFIKSKFRGGVHPKDFKDISRDEKLLSIDPGDEVIIPLVQHIGAPAAPNVKKGDKIVRGDIIGTPSGFISSLIHSSVAGTVKDIDLRPHPLGKNMMSVIVSPDTQAEERSSYKPKPQQQVDALSSKDIVSLVQKAGIAGMGGASFPTHVKLSPPKGKIIETLIINSAECEPYLTADETLVRNHAGEIIKGAKAIQKAIGAKRLIIAIEDNKPEAISVLRKALFEEGAIELIVLPTRYPQGGEKQLIQAVLYKEVPSGGLPMDVQALVQNTATAFAVYEAVYYDKPLIERVVTVTGHNLKQPGNYRIKIGTKLRDVLSQAGYEENPSSLAVMGGPMMGLPVIDMDTPVIKSTSGILIIDKVRLKKEFPCIRCGRCIEHCPMGLSPTEIASSFNRKDMDGLNDLHVTDCIECGCCSYVCPAGIPLVQYLKLSKWELRKNAQKKS